MTQSPRAWYQSGWTVSFIVFVLLPVAYFLYDACPRSPLPEVVPRFTVAVIEPLFADPSLELEVWHQHTADLENGILTVYTVDPAAEDDHRRKQQEEYSFASWPPNKDHAINLVLPLPDHQAGAETRFGVTLKSRTTTSSLREYSLLDGRLELVRDLREEWRRAVENSRIKPPYGANPQPSQTGPPPGQSLPAHPSPSRPGF